MNEAPGTTREQAGDFQWVFPWWRRSSRLVPMVLPITLGVIAFGCLLALVRVKVGSPQFEMERRGSLVYLPTDGDGLAWAVRAREAGPALSRYEPSTWSGFPHLDRLVAEATSVSTPPREPKLRDLPQADGVRTVDLAAKGQPVLPVRSNASATPAPVGSWRLVPTLFPLSPLNGAVMPATLPPFTDAVKPDMAIARRQFSKWQFLLRLGPDGAVTECLPQDPAIEGTAMLETWLKGVTFDPKLARNGGWFAVAVRFVIQADGTDDH